MAGSRTEWLPPDPVAWRQRVGRGSQVADVRLVELSDGAGRGTRLLEFASPSGLTLDVVVDRGFDLGACRLGGMPISWISPVGTRAPGLATAEHLGWLRSFGGGLLATAGLDHTMFPEEDETRYLAYPPKTTSAFPLHGRLSGEPARLLGYGVDHDAGTLWAEGLVRQAGVFAEVLTLRRRVEMDLRRPIITLRDVVTNGGHVPTPHMLLYHVNVGWPLLDEGARLVTTAVEAIPRGDHTVRGFDRMGQPKRGAVEEVTQLRFDGERAVVALANDRLGLAFVERFDTAVLPDVFVWRMLADGTYVLGLEPSTNGPEGRATARQSGRLRTLEPDESVSYDLTLELTDDLAGLPPPGPAHA
ncbi:DUF4432 family protein [Euzebya tangerina]|uniref:DUF4432 family protein n=1 Tax=Euzebya tangerina TaxID=591198 RepID=UPI000E321E6B|nr:DUF4432 family protein [Euzebya tangerina]